MRIQVLKDRKLVISNGVQKWYRNNNQCGYETIFQDGENQITIIRTYMIQDVDIVIVYSKKDGFNLVEQRLVRTLKEEWAINEMLAALEDRIRELL